MSGFIERAITIVVTGGPASAQNPSGGVRFGPNKSNTLTLAGFRVSAQITWDGPSSLVGASVSVFGMNESDMNAIASLGNPTYANNLNQISILAGDANSGMSLIFQGTLQTAVIDFNGVPDVCFNMTAYTGYGLMMQPIPPASFSGAASVASIMSSLAAAGAMTFENNGVTAVLSNPYFPGTLGQQIRACARHANIGHVIDHTKGGPNGTLAIWPKNGFRTGTIASISAATGMVGYPTYGPYGITVEMLFNPTLVYWGQLAVQSSLAPASKTWVIYGLTHNIESQTENGDWLTTADCWSLEFAGAQVRS